MATDDFRAAYLRDIAKTYRIYKNLGERAMAQVSEADLHRQLDPESNSMAIVAKHLAGNLTSRFTDFLTTDGEKPTRNREGEFQMPDPVTRAQILASWESGWAVALAAIDGLTPADLDRTVYIRAQPMLVHESLNRLVSHAAYHVGQIVFLAKHFAGPAWTSLTIPKKR
jgi:uncharacterized damage-inducible protein DinB